MTLGAVNEILRINIGKSAIQHIVNVPIWLLVTYYSSNKQCHLQMQVEQNNILGVIRVCRPAGENATLDARAA